MKKIFSILLSVMLILGTFPPVSFAETGEPTLKATSASPQTPRPTTLGKGEIFTDKSVLDHKDGSFDIVLTAIGRNFEQENTTPQENIDVLLVLDVSNSMNELSKLKNMKKAANEVSEKILAVSGNRVGILKFSDSANYDGRLNFTTLTTDVENYVKKLTADGGTFTQDAFRRAKQIMNERTGPQNKPIIILMSDGEPTYYYNSKNKIKGDGTYSGGNFVWNTVKEAMTIKNDIDNLDIYTIGFDVENNFGKATLMPTEENTRDYRNDISFNHKYWSEGSTITPNSDYQSLIDAFLKIVNPYLPVKPLQKIDDALYSDLIIEDTLGAHYKVIGDLPEGVTRLGDKLIWTIKGDAFNTMAFDQETVAVDNVHTVTIPVRLALNTIKKPGEYPTNNGAKAFYKVQSATQNPKYKDVNEDGLFEENLSNTGISVVDISNTLTTLTISKKVEGPLDTLQTFKFNIYDSLSGTTPIDGPVEISMNKPGTASATIQLNIPYSKFDANGNYTFYVQEEGQAPKFWTYDKARKMITVKRGDQKANVSFVNRYEPTGTLDVFKRWSNTTHSENIQFNVLRRPKATDAPWTPVGEPHTILAGQQTPVTLQNLDISYEYRVQESPIPLDFEAKYSLENIQFSTAKLEQSLTITNQFIPPTGTIHLKKVWTGDYAPEDLPEFLGVEVTTPDQSKETIRITPNTDGEWLYDYQTTDFGEFTFKELLPNDFATENASQKATLVVTPQSGRTTSVTFENSYVVPRATLNIEKSWIGDDTHLSYRPSEITVKVFYNETFLEEVVLNQENQYKTTLTDLDFGTYRLEEEAVEQYTTTLPTPITLLKNGERTGKLVIQNTFKPTIGRVNVIKEWHISNDIPAQIPESIEVTLYDASNTPVSTATLTAATQWQHTFENLDVNSTYTLVESEHEHFKSHIAYSSGERIAFDGTDVVKVTLSNIYAKGAVTLHKIWQDLDNPLAEQPESAVVRLIQEKTVVPEVIVPEKIEDTPAEGPSEQSTDLSANEPAEAPTEPADEPLPPRIERKVFTVILTRDEPSKTLVDLEIGPNVQYTIEEEQSLFYTAEISPSTFVLNEENAYQVVNITNTYTSPKGALTVNKNWNHGFNPAQPTDVTLHLYGDGQLLETVTFNGQHTFNNLPLGVHYTVKEEATSNYHSTIANNSYTPQKSNGTVPTGTINLTNTYIPETAQIAFTKIWDAPEGIALPESLRIRLTRYIPDSESLSTAQMDVWFKEITVDASTDWKGLFEDLTVYGPGGKYVYKAEEISESLELYDATNNDQVTLTPNQVASITITNKYAPEKGTLTLIKRWSNFDEQPLSAPVDSIELQLYINGEKEPTTMTLKAEDNWTLVRDGLDVTKSYDVKEVTTFEAFETRYSNEAPIVFTESYDQEIAIDNVRTEDKPSLEVTKVALTPIITLPSNQLKYEVTVKNTGNRTLEGIEIIDTLIGPANGQKVYQPAPDMIDSDGTVRYQMATALKPNESYTFSYTVLISVSGAYTNTAKAVGYYNETPYDATDDASATVNPEPTSPSGPTPPTDPTPTPTPTSQGTVNVSYVSTAGITLSAPLTLTGNVGTAYGTAAKNIDGYTLTETPSNASGNFESGTIRVVYVYDVITIPVDDEATPLGPIEDETATAPTETPSDEVVLVDESVPEGNGLPETGQWPYEVYFFIGILVMGAGFGLKRYDRIKRELNN